MKISCCVQGLAGFLTALTVGSASAAGNFSCPAVAAIIESADGTHYAAPGIGAHKWVGENPMAMPGDVKKFVFREAHISKDKRAVACDYVIADGVTGGARMTLRLDKSVAPQGTLWASRCVASDPLQCQFK